MAQVMTIAGAMVGFIAALVGFFAFNIGFLAAFAIWAMSGPVAALLAFVMSGSQIKPLEHTGARAFDAAA